MRTSAKNPQKDKKAPAAMAGPRGVSLRAPMAQARLSVRPPEDRLERQADRAAAHAIARLNNLPTEGNAPPAGQLGRESVSGEDGLHLPPAIESELTGARQGGRPMEAGLRTAMEGALNADFGDVRIHTDQQSHALSRALQAHAFTTGQHIFFGAGAFDPSHTEGRRVIAHELTHVIQQGDSPQAIQRIKIAGKAVGAGLLAFQIGGDRFGEVMDILNGPLKDGDYLNNDAAKVAVDGILSSCDVYTKYGPLRIEGTGSRCNVHLGHSAVVGYFRKQRDEIAEGDEQSLVVGEGKVKKNRLYGQVLYSHKNGVIRYWHAHDAGKMG